MRHERFRFTDASQLRAKAASLNIELPWSEDIELLLHPTDIGGMAVPNRLVVQPMEGFDSSETGEPGELAFRRYNRYAAGGNGVIWFEACSVVPEGRSNPHQMMITPATVPTLKKLTAQIRQTTETTYGPSHRPFLVLQLTHSGRYSFEEKQRSGVRSDQEITRVMTAYQEALTLAEQAGFDAVDVKACHGYLLHELLTAYNRTDSQYGGSFENRTRFLREVFTTPSKILKVMRLGAFDLIPYPQGFGMKNDGSNELDLSEVKRFIQEFSHLVPLWNITAGIPRIAPHVGRPYDRGAFNATPPEEHPLEGIARLIRVTGELQQAFPTLKFTGTGYSWLRQYYPYVGAGVLKEGKASFIGLGRSSFAYPDSPRDLMITGKLNPKKTCVACSKCTEMMRNGGPAGCAVRDTTYNHRNLKELKKNQQDSLISK
ncbi:MAG: hypothetical protein PHF53_03985 [Bacteroidales bacterium]|jgi:2,4-dienoyl-CoA reductase-like NADH-dependent reductase (Old Yellow Enzyme family)|nr:hypothetical protein [Bacteroidales bacterium]MDD2812558.1 hypothetical protein [Bacteroidales bacterium]MDD3872239.1 hypothetical protein [Bacteroidales bacterium]MDD4811992.1 hypothetical protein [Bacteroidales bacterium]